MQRYAFYVCCNTLKSTVKAYNYRYSGIFPYLCTICPDCFCEGYFPSNLSSSNFARVEGPSSIPPTDNMTPNWSDEEVLALLQGIELHDDNWRRISDYVGSRTVEECIVKFGNRNCPLPPHIFSFTSHWRGYFPKGECR